MSKEIVQRIQKLIKMVEMTKENEPDCSQVYELMDEVAELTAQGVDLSVVMPEIHHHLETCGCCHGEFTVLKSIIEAEVDA